MADQDVSPSTEFPVLAQFPQLPLCGHFSTLPNFTKREALSEGETYAWAMLARLAHCAREARESAGLTQLEIAIAAEVAHSTISYFETGRRQTRELDRIVSVYERECGLEPGTIWRRASD